MYDMRDMNGMYVKCATHGMCVKCVWHTCMSCRAFCWHVIHVLSRHAVTSGAVVAGLSVSVSPCLAVNSNVTDLLTVFLVSIYFCFDG